jgi:hypothetical protein
MIIFNLFIIINYFFYQIIIYFLYYKKKNKYIIYKHNIKLNKFKFFFIIKH